MELIDPRDKIILVDGECNLCNGFVQFVAKRDRKLKFYFASLQSHVGQELLRKYDVRAQTLSTMVLIDKSKAYVRSDAALNAIMQLGRGWILLGLIKLLPSFIRNKLYDYVASKRYQWFGKSECMLPDQGLVKRILDYNFTN
jgi:predicted DCC family thiol-disulfide oxidoreductase YuxK